MNLLTDIIRDVALQYGMTLTKDEELKLQHEVMVVLVAQVSCLKDRQVSRADFPWLEKSRSPVEVV